MAKVNVFNLTRPERPTITRSFEENGERLTIAFHKADAAELALAAELADQLIEAHITGSEIRGPAPFYYPDVKLSRLLCNNVAIAVQTQEVEDPADAYDEKEFLVMSVRMPETWLGIQRILQELNAGPPAPGPNGASPAAPTG